MKCQNAEFSRNDFPFSLETLIWTQVDRIWKLENICLWENFDFWFLRSVENLSMLMVNLMINRFWSTGYKEPFMHEKTKQIPFIHLGSLFLFGLTTYLCSP